LTTLPDAQLRALCDVLRKARETANVSMHEVGRHGVDKATVFRIEHYRFTRVPAGLDRIFEAYAAAVGTTASALRDEWLRRVGEWIAQEQERN
jgi:hypothetical protein